MLGFYLGGAVATFVLTLVHGHEHHQRWMWNTAALCGVFWFLIVPLDVIAATRGPRDG